ncbi:MAG: pyridoxal phosphate-dependent aminotransferase, partial [Planctomycetota bacterium]
EDYQPLTLYDPGRTPVSVDLSDNTNLWGAHPAAIDAIRDATPEALSRYPSVYGHDLKEAVAERFGVPPENVVTGCGSDDLLDSAFRASVFPPGRLIYPSPSFSMVEAFARMNGMETHAVEWRKAEVDPARILLEEPDLVYVCRPNNPTGASLPRDWILGLLALGGMDGPLVVLDEAYADFAEESFIGDAVDSGRLLVLRTLSKLYGLAGLRVGFGVGPRHVIEEVEKSRGPYKVSQIAEQAAVAALGDQSGWLEGVAEEARQNRARLAQELESRGLKPLPSDANFLLVPVEPANAMEVNRALRDHGVAARPFPGLPEVGDALRVTVGPWDMMETFLSALDQLLVHGADGGVEQ